MLNNIKLKKINFQIYFDKNILLLSIYTTVFLLSSAITIATTVYSIREEAVILISLGGKSAAIHALIVTNEFKHGSHTKIAINIQTTLHRNERIFHFVSDTRIRIGMLSMVLKWKETSKSREERHAKKRREKEGEERTERMKVKKRGNREQRSQ